MWGIPYWDTDPKVNSHWALRGNENAEDADYIILAEKKKDEINGVSYRWVYGRSKIHRSGPDTGWISLDYLNKHFLPWNDPWAKVKQRAKEWGFVFKDKI